MVAKAIAVALLIAVALAVITVAYLRYRRHKNELDHERTMAESERRHEEVMAVHDTDYIDEELERGRR